MKTMPSLLSLSLSSLSSVSSYKRRTKAILTLSLVLGIAGVLVSEAAFAHGRRARIHFGFTFGAPLYWHSWYPGPHYYSPYYHPPAPVVIAPAPRPVYVERERVEEAPVRQDSASWWYYCRDANAYYPYVKQCPAGWERVAPQPPSG